MNDEVMPVGTAARLAQLEAGVERLRAQQAEPQWCDCEPTRCEGVGRCRWQAMKYVPPAQQAEPVTVKDLQQMLVDVDLVDPHAIDDPDGYDGGFTLTQINELHARLTEGQR